MLERIFAAPIPSPYTRYLRVLVYVRKPVVMSLALFLVLSTSVAYASQKALPGETLYAIKTRVVEPLIGVTTFAPIEKLEWEQEKVVRRITEAKALVEKDELDEEKTKSIEKDIEKSSLKFGAAAEEISKRSATSSEKQAEKNEELKRRFRENLDIKKGQRENKDDDKIERLKDRAVRALDERSKKGQSEED